MILPISSRFPSLVILSGVALTLLYVVGASVGPHSLLYDLFFVLHLALFLLALLGAGADYLLSVRALPHRGAKWILLFLLIFLLFCLASQATLPPSARDSLIHHLSVPKWWLEQNTLSPIPWHSWSFYPMQLQLAFTGFLKWNLEVLCSLYHGAYLVLLAALVKRICETLHLSRAHSLLGFLVVLTIPTCIRLSTIPLVDLGLATFFTLGQLYFLKWFQNPAMRSFALLSGVSLGIALSTKLNAIVGIAAMIVAAIFTTLLQKTAPRTVAISFLVCGVFATILYLPWMYRAAYATGNPVYPLLPSIFSTHYSASSSPAAADQEGSFVRGLSPLETRMLLHGESLYSIAALPLRLFIEGEDDNPRKFDGVLTPFLLTSLLGLFLFLRSPEAMFFPLYSWILIFAALSFADARIRYLAPAFGSLVISSMLVINSIQSKFSWGRKIAMPFVTLTHGLPALLYLIAMCIGTQGFVTYWKQDETRISYLRRSVADYEMIEYINSHLPRHAKVYLLFTGNRFYYFERSVESPGHLSTNFLVKLLREQRTPSALAEYFSERGITHLMINKRRFVSSVHGVLSPSQQEVWQEFVAHHLSLLHSIQGNLLFEVRAHGAPSIITEH